jgi:hypothetical protein
MLQVERAGVFEYISSDWNTCSFERFQPFGLLRRHEKKWDSGKQSVDLTKRQNGYKA